MYEAMNTSLGGTELYSKRINSASEICIYFLPRMKDDSKRTKMHLNESGLNKSEFCESVN